MRFLKENSNKIIFFIITTLLVRWCYLLSGLKDYPTEEEMMTIVYGQRLISFWASYVYTRWYFLLSSLTGIKDIYEIYRLNVTIILTSLTMLLFFLNRKNEVSLLVNSMMTILFISLPVHLISERMIGHFTLVLFLSSIYFHQRQKLSYILITLAALTRPEFAIPLYFKTRDIFYSKRVWPKWLKIFESLLFVCALLLLIRYHPSNFREMMADNFKAYMPIGGNDHWVFLEFFSEHGLRVFLSVIMFGVPNITSLSFGISLSLLLLIIIVFGIYLKWFEFNLKVPAIAKENFYFLLLYLFSLIFFHQNGNYYVLPIVFLYMTFANSLQIKNVSKILERVSLFFLILFFTMTPAAPRSLFDSIGFHKSALSNEHAKAIKILKCIYDEKPDEIRALVDSNVSWYLGDEPRVLFDHYWLIRNSPELINIKKYNFLLFNQIGSEEAILPKYPFFPNDSLYIKQLEISGFHLIGNANFRLWINDEGLSRAKFCL